MKLTEDNGNVICDIAKVKLQKDDVLVLDFGNAEMTPDRLDGISKTVHDGIELKVINGGTNNE